MSAIAIVRFGPLLTGDVDGVVSVTSVFGHLASVFVLLLYLWLSANAFLVGIQVDACVRERA